MSNDDLKENLDFATTEVIRNYLTSAATEMRRTLMRTAYSAAIYEILDFGISLYDKDFNLIADSPGLNLFLGANDYSIRKGVEYVGKNNLNPGDILVMNYPYWSSAHTMDVCLFSPVFFADEIIGYTVSRAHWLDVGQKDSGYVHDSTDVHQEGLIFPGTKIFKRGEPDDELFELIRFNTRMPDRVIGDINAQVAAVRTGKKRLRELHNEYGTNTVQSSITRILARGEERARAALEELPDGTWTAVDYVDDDGITDNKIRMEVETTIEDDRLSIDFSGSDDEVEGPLNVPIGMTQTICKLCLKTLTTPREPSNGGQFEPLTVTVPDDNVFNASYPAPTFTLWTAILGIDVIYKALAKGMPTQLPASSGGDICSMMVVGQYEGTDQWFIEGIVEGVGWGATHNRDGQNGLMHISESAVQNSPIEVVEHKAPIRITRLELREDSGGPGKFRGGLGIRRDFKYLQTADAITTVKKTKTDGWGIDGGKPGMRNAVVVRPNTEAEEWTGTTRETLDPGEIISNRSGGGGGYGDPFERNPQDVLTDVQQGYVSVDSAREDYGVVITDDEEVDVEATNGLRD